MSGRETKSMTQTRGFAARLAALAAAVCLCWSGAALAADAEDTVVFAGYGGTLEQFLRNTILPSFEKATGIKLQLVIGTALSNYAKVVASRSNPEIDVYWSNELTHAAGKQQGLYARLDPAVVTNLPDVIDIARDPDDIGVASYLLANGIEYNTKALADAGIPAPRSWNDLWDPRLKGKVALYSFGIAYSQDLLAIMTRLAGGKETDIKPGLEKIKSLRTIGNLARFATTPAEMDNMLVQGQAWVTVNGSTRAFILNDKGAPISFSFPKEGAGFFTNYLDPVKNAPHPMAAQVFINFLLRPDIQLEIAKETVAAPINRKVAVPADLARKIPYGDEQLKNLIHIDRVVMNRDLDNWAEQWNREIESAH